MKLCISLCYSRSAYSLLQRRLTVKYRRRTTRATHIATPDGYPSVVQPYTQQRPSPLGSGNTAPGISALFEHDRQRQLRLRVIALYSNTSGNDTLPLGGKRYTATKPAALTRLRVAALYTNTNGYQNTATGASALGFNQGASTIPPLDGRRSIATLAAPVTPPPGYKRLQATRLLNNTADGLGALGNNNGGSDNAAVGVAALGNNTASGNTAVGYYSLQGVAISGTYPDGATGSNNTGMASKRSIRFRLAVTMSPLGTRRSIPTQRNYNNASGYFALHNNSSGSQNSAPACRRCMATRPAISIPPPAQTRSIPTRRAQPTSPRAIRRRTPDDR